MRVRTPSRVSSKRNRAYGWPPCHFSERLARVLYDPQAVQEDRLVDVIQEPGFRVVSREAAGENAVKPLRPM